MDDDTINEYTEDSLEEWEETGGMNTWEAAFVRGERAAFEDSEPLEEEL